MPRFANSAVDLAGIVAWVSFKGEWCDEIDFAMLSQEWYRQHPR